jgi:hypothetical protein
VAGISESGIAGGSSAIKSLFSAIFGSPDYKRGAGKTSGEGKQDRLKVVGYRDTISGIMKAGSTLAAVLLSGERRPFHATLDPKSH